MGRLLNYVTSWTKAAGMSKQRRASDAGERTEKKVERIGAELNVWQSDKEAHPKAPQERAIRTGEDITTWEA